MPARAVRSLAGKTDTMHEESRCREYGEGGVPEEPDTPAEQQLPVACQEAGGSGLRLVTRPDGSNEREGWVDRYFVTVTVTTSSPRSAPSSARARSTYVPGSSNVAFTT